MSKMVLRIKGPEKLPTGYHLMLHVSATDAQSLGVFYLHSKVYTHVLGRQKLFYKTRYTGTRELEFFVEGLRFPDEGFNGLVSIKASLLESQVEVGMGVPTRHSGNPNIHRLCGISDLSPHNHSQHSGSRRGLRLQGPDFGYVTKVADADEVTSLDSFGNLEVSPPVTVRGKNYPLGRILIGSSFPTTSGRRMTKVVRDFLHAQRVQPPIELFSDWLFVGHVDEFLTFVPAPNQKVSPPRRLCPAGVGGTFFIMCDGTEYRSIRVFHIIDTKRCRALHISFHSLFVPRQHCIDWNRDILKRELGLTEDDIIDIPALFKLQDGQATAFFPNMVNMIVLGKILGIPKPYGPVIKETCCLEDYVVDQLKPLDLTCTFIDDVVSYHKKLGEVHCGTNVRRKPFSFKWWQMEEPQSGN
ncbi:hypothetical protein AB205_0028810 [Aquarana catesbeiana]|uniref:Protein-arginine deiminase C-terminal domain-containing protein n=1 Tax=Aquarana catesbeiana TaxID=8400 RepID=A0A2G9R9X0_AQUCT|nr:hypothetical protein AB205_0028810 [Aquarana catesbeiana]